MPDAGTAACALLRPGGAAIVLTACSSNHDQLYDQYFQAVKQSFAASFGNQRVSREEAAAIPYASMGFRVDEGRQGMLVLATDTGGEMLWTAKSHIVILTRDGRISRTVGLPHDISAVTPQTGQVLPPPSAALRGQVSSMRLADFPDISAYGVPLHCTASAAGRETIVILGSAMPTVRVNESCRSAQLRWSFVDSYWIDPQSGLVWRSIQHIHPKGRNRRDRNPATAGLSRGQKTGERLALPIFENRKAVLRRRPSRSWSPVADAVVAIAGRHQADAEADHADAGQPPSPMTFHLGLLHTGRFAGRQRRGSVRSSCGKRTGNNQASRHNGCTQ